MESFYNKKWKTLLQKEKLHILCNFFFCHYVFKKPSAAEASESVYMRERVKHFCPDTFKVVCCRFALCGKGLITKISQYLEKIGTCR